MYTPIWGGGDCFFIVYDVSGSIVLLKGRSTSSILYIGNAFVLHWPDDIWLGKVLQIYTHIIMGCFIYERAFSG